jgi:hypothetical protein
MVIDNVAELGVLGRFCIGVLSCSIAYISVMMAVMKYEGGLYDEHAIPQRVSPAMKRARRFFLLACLCVAVGAGLLSWEAHRVLDQATFYNYVWPALGGALFSMLYGASTRYDRIRPREDR